MDCSQRDYFVRPNHQQHQQQHQQPHEGGSSSSSARWSFGGRRSFRNLAAALLKPRKSRHSGQPMTQLADSNVNSNVGRADDFKAPSGTVRTTLLGCPGRLRASLPPSHPSRSTSPQQQQQHPHRHRHHSRSRPAIEEHPLASPLFQTKRRTKESKQQQPQPALNSIPDEDPRDQDDATDTQQLHQHQMMSSLLLEFRGEIRRVDSCFTSSGDCLLRPADIWSLFAGEWPAAVQALGPDWHVLVLLHPTLTSSSSSSSTCRWAPLPDGGASLARLLRPGCRLRLEGSAAAGNRCSCALSLCCTCEGLPASGAPAPAPNERFERLEAQVTSLSQRLVADNDDDNSDHRERRHRARLLAIRDECRRLRRDQDAMRSEHQRGTRETRQMMSDLACSLRRMLLGGGAADAAATSSDADRLRRQLELELDEYRRERAEVSGLLDDLDQTTGELRQDVLRRRCRSSPAEVELLALHLSRATQRLASLKNRFPAVRTRTRDLLRREADVAAGDERFLADEEQRLDGWLGKVKRLTMLLFTFKQLADAQAKEASSLVPIVLPPGEGCWTLPPDEAASVEAITRRRRADLLSSIASVCPDHERRAEECRLAEVACRRRQRMVREAAALRAEKTLAAAAGRLRRPAARVRRDPTAGGGGE